MERHNQITKQSYGLACCKFIDGILHVLMVKKKYSYAFFEFVFCKYPKFDRKKLDELFNGMTFQEKKDILELNFDKLWCKIVLNVPDDPNSMAKKTKLKKLVGKLKTDVDTKEIEEIEEKKYEMTPKEKEYQTYLIKKNRFIELIDDGGRKLRDIISHSKSADPIWEIPKGRPECNEKPFDTAIREFYEETTINIDKYRILYDINPIKINYVIGDCLYNNEYFVAIADKDLMINNEYNRYDNNIEVEEIRWINVNEVPFLNKGQHTYKRMISLVNCVSKIVKQNKPLYTKMLV